MTILAVALPTPNASWCLPQVVYAEKESTKIVFPACQTVVPTLYFFALASCGSPGRPNQHFRRFDLDPRLSRERRLFACARHWSVSRTPAVIERGRADAQTS